MPFFSREDPHRKRLKRLLHRIEEATSPAGWSLVVDGAVGGLTDLGFSRQGPYLLCVSGQGRGVFHCGTGEKVAREQLDPGSSFDTRELTCRGIGPIASEIVRICGLHGGGLPLGNLHGDQVQIVAPDWPVQDLYFCHSYRSPLVEGHHSKCCLLHRGDLRAYGFSWCGDYLVSATGSDLKLWRRDSEARAQTSRSRALS